MIPSRAELRDHLIKTLISGEVATPRQNNLLHFRRMAAGNPYYRFGLEFKGSWTEAEILAMMAERVGVSPDPRHFYGDDTIDPELTIDALEAMAERLAAAARDRAKVLLATGHPTGLLPVYLATGRALAAAGCTILTPANGWTYEIEGDYGPRERRICYVEGVAMLRGGGALHHTHDAAPMRAMLEELAGDSDNWPDLVMADHGWAGAAGQAGVETVGFADCNDPALFAGAAEGKIAVAVPLDDNVLPHHYAPMTAYLLDRAGLARITVGD